jgi:hypothetical protein
MKKLVRKIVLAIMTAAVICIGVFTVSYAAEQMGPPPGGPNSSLISETKEGNKTIWTMKNDAVKAVVQMENGSIDMTSFYGVAAGKEYLTGSGARSLFTYKIKEAGKTLSALSGNWTLKNADISNIEQNDTTWGQELKIVLVSDDVIPVQITMSFQMYKGSAGLRYQCFIQNNSDSNMTITESDILQLNFENKAHEAFYVPNMIWTSTTGALNNTRNCVMVYDTGDGWCMVPELNWKTNVEATEETGDGFASDTTNPPFGGIYAWANGEASVRFSSNPSSLQLVLFPGEEMQYLAVNLTAFQGDSLDGRAAIEDHFTQRYKYVNKTLDVSLNDWEWFSNGNRTDEYYRTTVLKAALATGIDRINVDDSWNTTKDTVIPESSFTSDLAALSKIITNAGVEIGYWWSPTGVSGMGFPGGPGGGGPGGPMPASDTANALLSISSASTLTATTYVLASSSSAAAALGVEAVTDAQRDFANWNEVLYKFGQMEDVLINQYHSSWTQIDLLQTAQNTETTQYSHASDSVYRKAVNLTKYQNLITSKYPNFTTRVTNELDFGLMGDKENNETRNSGLIYLADNGMVSALGEYQDGDLDIAMQSFGYFPMDSVFEYYENGYFVAKTEWLYQMLATRESVIYTDPDSMLENEEACALLKTFNTWRKNDRMLEVLNGSFRPVEDEDSYAFMYLNEDKSKAMLLATDARRLYGDYLNSNTEESKGFQANIRWLEDDKTYLVEDITLRDDNTFSYSFVTLATGAELKEKGIYVDYTTNDSNGKAYWFEEYTGSNMQLVYADYNITSYTEKIRSGDYKLSVEGTANTEAEVILYNKNTGKTKVYTVKIAKNGKGTLTVEDVVALKDTNSLKVSSSNSYAQELFSWAIEKTQQFVMTGQGGLVNKSERNASGTGFADYIPSYWAGYYHRTAFYGRDFIHQSVGASIVGLTDENYSMLSTFAKSATAERKWYALWAFNFDGSTYTLDYTNDSNFVREVPAQFELVEKAYELYLWTGDESYISDDMFNFYTKVMTDFISLHDDQLQNGVAEGYGSIFTGSCTYNERGEFPIESGDAIGSQYQATLAYAGILKARGDNEESQEWYQKAADLKTYFNEVWSVNETDPDGNYARVITSDLTKLYDFGKENSWFMPLKLITEPGSRNDAYIDFILENLGEGIGTTDTAPTNIEAYTYIPDMLFPYNRADDAWKWMKYIGDVKDNAHEVAAQGTNGDYPEISYTLVSQFVEGMMGVEPNVADGIVATSPRLPQEIGDLAVENITFGDFTIDLAMEGNQKTVLTNHSEKSISWEARFYGDYDYIIVNGVARTAKHKQMNGETISYIRVSAGSGKMVTAQASDR